MRRLAKAVLKATSSAGRGCPWGFLRGVAPAVRVELADADVPQVTQSADTFRQACQEARLFQHRDISGRPGTLSATSTISPLSSSTAIWLFRVCCFFFPL